MSDEYEHKLEAKSDIVSDASSVGTPDIDAVPDAEIPDQEFITHTVGGLLMFFHKMQNILEYNTL